MLKVFLKYDFALATWFVPKKNTGIEPVISHLFLTKVSFIFLAIYCTLIKYLPVKLSIEVFVTGILLGTGLIMYSMQKIVARWVREYGLKKEYKTITKKKRGMRNAIGLFLMFFVYLAAFYIAVKTIGGTMY